MEQSAGYGKSSGFPSVQGDAPECASSVNNDREQEDILSSLFPSHPSPVGIELKMQQHVEFFFHASSYF